MGIGSSSAEKLCTLAKSTESTQAIQLSSTEFDWEDLPIHGGSEDGNLSNVPELLDCSDTEDEVETDSDSASDVPDLIDCLEPEDENFSDDNSDDEEASIPLAAFVEEPLILPLASSELREPGMEPPNLDKDPIAPEARPSRAQHKHPHQMQAWQELDMEADQHHYPISDVYVQCAQEVLTKYAPYCTNAHAQMGTEFVVYQVQGNQYAIVNSEVDDVLVSK